MHGALKLIEKAALQERLAHLLLFHGGSLLERRAFTMHLAQILNCQSEVRPCGHCVSCRKIKSENHPDVSRIEPQKSSIGIEQILSWQERVYRTHYEGRYKVFLLERADTLTLPAGNALLKIVEEPPMNTIIVLSADNGEGILPTIRSRAQCIYFPPTLAEDWLAKHEHLGEEGKKAIVLSGYNPDLAAEILEIGLGKLEDWLARFWQAVKEKDFLQLFPLFPLEKEEGLVLLQMLAVQIQQAIKEGKDGAKALLAVGNAIDGLREQANPRLVFEVLALELFN